MSTSSSREGEGGGGGEGGQNQQQQQHSNKVWLYQVLLTLQYGSQPLLMKCFVAREAIVTSLVLACEAVKVVCALLLLLRQGALRPLLRQWTLAEALSASALPATIYALQNSLLQISYRALDSLTFSILNQTKLLSTALFAFLLLGHKQSPQQILALGLLLLAAVLLTVGEGTTPKRTATDTDTSNSNSNPLLLGILPLLAASLLSGLASALCQWASQVKRHASYLMTVEMSLIGSLILLATLPHSPDGQAIRKHGFFHGWTPWTLVY